MAPAWPLFAPGAPDLTAAPAGPGRGQEPNAPKVPVADRATRVVASATRGEWGGALALLTLLELTWIRPTMAASRAAGVTPLIEHLIFAAFVDLMLWTLLTPVIFSALDHLPVTPSAAPSGSRHALRGELRRMLNIAGWIAVTAGAAGGQAWLVHNLWSAASQWSEPAQRTLTSPLLGLPYLIETNLQPALLLVLYYAILFRRHRTKRDEERAARLERSLFEARLHVISRQLEPHFLFNTLNAIAGLTSEQPAVAEAMLVRLSELLRIAFDSSVGETVSLQTELERLDMYTDLYCMRFGDRLTVRRVVEATTLSAAVPTFLLQPLVENAIAHGFAARRGTGAIDISARRVGARIELIVQDDGTGFTPGGPRREGVGLGSTRARLEAMFPATHSIELQSSPDVGTRVTITFPAARVGETEPGAESPAVLAMRRV